MRTLGRRARLTGFAWLLTLTLGAALAVPAAAAPCKDAKGKFVKCPDKKPARCKTAQGRFVKCGTPGARPA